MCGCACTRARVCESERERKILRARVRIYCLCFLPSEVFVSFAGLFYIQKLLRIHRQPWPSSETSKLLPRLPSSSKSFIATHTRGFYMEQLARESILSTHFQPELPCNISHYCCFHNSKSVKSRHSHSSLFTSQQLSQTDIREIPIMASHNWACCECFKLID